MSDPYKTGDPSADNSLEKEFEWEELLPIDREIDDLEELYPIIIANINYEISKLDLSKSAQVKIANKLTSIGSSLQQVIKDDIYLLDVEDLFQKIHSETYAFYDCLLSTFDLHQITVEPNKFGLWCGLDLYKNRKLSIEGLTLPNKLTLLEPCTWKDQQDISNCASVAILAYLKQPQFYKHLVNRFIPFYDSWNTFINPILNPKPDCKTTRLFGQVNLSTEGKAEVNSRVAIHNKDYPFINSCNVKPLRVVPHRDWFPDSVKSLKAEDIITIFPTTELKVFQLIIGRALIGPSGSIPIGHKKPITHTARTSGIIKGQPGNGKSDLSALLEKSFEAYGYVVKTTRSFSERFGMGEIAMCDLLIKDDTVNDDLVKLTKSAAFKSFITSDPICAEKKGKDATYVRPRAAVLINANEWDANNAYSADEGNASRLRILETIDAPIRDSQLKDIGEDHVWHGLTKLGPQQVIPHLASKFGVDVSVIMGWFFRLSLDFFYESIEDLEKIDKLLESGLRTRIASSPATSLVKALRLAHMLAEGPTNDHLSLDQFTQSLRYLCCILLDCRTGGFLDIIKADWEKSYRSKDHFWSTVRNIPIRTLLLVYKIASGILTKTGPSGLPYARDEFIRQVLRQLSTVDGIQVSPSPSNFYAKWGSPGTMEEVNHLFTISKDSLDKSVFSVDIENPKASVITAWFSDNLNHKQVRKAREEALFLHKNMKEKFDETKNQTDN